VRHVGNNCDGSVANGNERPTDQHVQHYLRAGLRNRRWPILPSRLVETGGKPIGITRLAPATVRSTYPVAIGAFAPGKD
jgi:hypothetical protein